MAGGNKKASRHFFVPLFILLKKSSLLLFWGKIKKTLTIFSSLTKIL